jgi:hypothetical protein
MLSSVNEHYGYKSIPISVIIILLFLKAELI